MTFGWGSPLETTWPRLLEERLRAKSRDVEVANLGQPGSSPREYASIAERAIPQLKPDLVVVTLHQGDDLAQLRQELALSVATKPFPRLRRAANFFVGNLRKAAARALSRSPGPPVRVRDVWTAQAKKLLARFDGEARKRYESLDEKLRTAFVEGLVNPLIVTLLADHPDYVSAIRNLQGPSVRPLIDRMAEQLAWRGPRLKSAQIRALVEAGGLQMGLFDERSLFEFTHPTRGSTFPTSPTST